MTGEADVLFIRALRWNLGEQDLTNSDSILIKTLNQMNSLLLLTVFDYFKLLCFLSVPSLIITGMIRLFRMATQQPYIGGRMWCIIVAKQHQLVACTFIIEVQSYIDHLLLVVLLLF